MAMKQTIIEMIEKIPGGKSAVAGFLGFSEAELNLSDKRAAVQRRRIDCYSARVRRNGLHGRIMPFNRRLFCTTP